MNTPLAPEKPIHPSEAISIEVLGALRELVELKQMKDSETFTDEQLDDYNKRKPVAWAAAKRIVAKYKWLGVKA